MKHESHNKPALVRESYEVTDVSVQGILIFLAGLSFRGVFFFVSCLRLWHP
jgi:hypothetical protein